MSYNQKYHWYIASSFSFILSIETPMYCKRSEVLTMSMNIGYHRSSYLRARHVPTTLVWVFNTLPVNQLLLVFSCIVATGKCFASKQCYCYVWFRNDHVFWALLCVLKSHFSRNAHSDSWRGCSMSKLEQCTLETSDFKAWSRICFVSASKRVSEFSNLSRFGWSVFLSNTRGQVKTKP